jgi:hypothetical protein
MNQPVSSVSVAPQVRMLLDGFARAIGVGNRCSLRWDRTGAGTFDLIGGQADQWTTERIYGRLGRFSAECSNLAVAVNDPYLQYEVSHSDLKLTAGCVLPGMADRLSPSHPAAVGAGAEPVGAIGLTTVFSLLSIVWVLLHPRVTLNLPGSIEIDAVLTDANTLDVTFKTPPTVTIVWGIQFSCQPNSLRLTEHSASVEYKAGWFARNKQWSW